MASGGNDSTVTFNQALQRLKQQGCSLLVVGSVPDSVLATASRQMLGDPNLRRDRLFVLTDADTSSVRRQLPATDPHSVSRTTKIINHMPSARTTATQTGTEGVQITEEFVYDENLDVLCEAVKHAIAEFEGREGNRDPGRLRLCLDSLTPLVDRYDHDLSFHFLNQLTTAIRGARGMGHFLLPVDRDARSVDRFQPLFDAIVELRIVNGSSEQERWHLPEEGVVTDWMPL